MGLGPMGQEKFLLLLRRLGAFVLITLRVVGINLVAAASAGIVVGLIALGVVAIVVASGFATSIGILHPGLERIKGLFVDALAPQIGLERTAVDGNQHWAIGLLVDDPD